MVSTPIKLTNTNTNFDYHPGFKIIYKADNWGLSESVMLQDKMVRPLGESLRLVSPNKKVLLSAFTGMFHFWYDTAGPLLSFIKEHQDVEVIIDSSLIKDNLDGPFFNFFLQILKDNNIKYQTITFERLDSIVVNNFYIHERIDRIYNPPATVYEYAKQYLDTSVTPFRVAYLSRREIPDRTFDGEERMPGLSFNHDNRIDDERKLEGYLASVGVEIVVPEDFASFKDQIKYFNEVKTVMSLTSSGLTNAIFMQPGGNVLEFVTPLIAGTQFVEGSNLRHAEEAMHNLYNLISFFKNHTYVGVQNNSRQVDELIKNLKAKNIIDRIVRND